MHEPSAEQAEAVRRVVAATLATMDGAAAPRHFLVSAVAGSGKTSVLERIVRTIRAERPVRARILLLVFNAANADLVSRRLADVVVSESEGGEGEKEAGCVHVHTLHAFGLRLLRRAAAGSPITVDPDKAYRTWRRLAPSAAASAAAWEAVRRTIDGIRHAGCVDLGPRPLPLAHAVVEAMAADRDTVDLEDGVYQCLVRGVTTPRDARYDLCCLDEAQDLNAAEQAFLARCLPLSRTTATPTTRGTVLCAVGDPGQAIYGFRGADPASLDTLRGLLQPEELRLTYCFRCPQRVITVAAHLQPAIRAAPGAPLGGPVCVRYHADDRALVEDEVRRMMVGGPDHMLVVARCNQALLELAVRLTDAETPLLAPAAVRWIAPALAGGLARWTATAHPGETLGALVRRCTSAATDPPAERAVVRVLEYAAKVDGTDTAVCASPVLGAVLAALETPPGPDVRLTLATMHASKGLEFPRVIVLGYHLLRRGRPCGDRPVQDANLLYIAVTRAQNALTFVVPSRKAHAQSGLLIPSLDASLVAVRKKQRV